MISTESVQSRVPRWQAEGDMRTFSSWETWRKGEKGRGHRPISGTHRCSPSWPCWSQSCGFHAFLSLVNSPSSGSPKHWIPSHPSKKKKLKKNKQPIKNRVIFGKCCLRPFFRKHAPWYDLSFSGSSARHMWEHDFGAHSLEHQQWHWETCILQLLCSLPRRGSSTHSCFSTASCVAASVWRGS